MLSPENTSADANEEQPVERSEKPKLDLSTNGDEGMTDLPLESPAGSSFPPVDDEAEVATKSTTERLKESAQATYAKAKEMVGGSVELAQNKASEIAAMGLSKGMDAAEKVYDATKAAREAVSAHTQAAKDAVSARTKAATEAVSAQTKAATEAVKRNLDWSKTKLAEMREKAMEKYPSYFPGGKLDSDIELFQRALTDGSEPVELKRGETWQLPFMINVGDTIRWEFVVLKYDVYFRVAIRIMGTGGAVEEETRPRQLCKCGETHRGSYTAYMAGQVIVSWDNKHAWMRLKHVAYSVSIVRAPKRESSSSAPVLQPPAASTPSPTPPENNEGAEPAVDETVASNDNADEVKKEEGEADAPQPEAAPAEATEAGEAEGGAAVEGAEEGDVATETSETTAPADANADA